MVVSVKSLLYLWYGNDKMCKRPCQCHPSYERVIVIMVIKRSKTHNDVCTLRALLSVNGANVAEGEEAVPSSLPCPDVKFAPLG